MKNEKLQHEIDRLKEQVKLYKFDYLTGMKQRQDFQHEVKQKFNRGSFYIVMYDIDGLHRINREQGYAQGDALIVQVANDIRMCNGACCSYRLNGDEFYVVYNSEPLAVEVENATHEYVNSANFNSFQEMVDAVDKKLTERKILLNRRRDD